MDEDFSHSDSYKLCCSGLPNEFFTDKSISKQYFRQFGRIKRVILRRKQRMCVAEYLDNDSLLNALNNAGTFEGQNFEVTVGDVHEDKMEKIKDPDWTEDPDVRSELRAMEGTVDVKKKYNLRQEKMLVDVVDKPKTPKLKRSWKTLDSTNPTTTPKKKKTADTDTVSSSKLDQQALIKILRQPGTTVPEKFKILDARDKLFRLKLKKTVGLKSTATVGTCPDMCPEKERLMRETQHQVALYEIEAGGREMDQRFAVKQYSRSSADQEAPLPHELRPVGVLQMTIGYLMHEIMDICDTPNANLAEWFHFLWDRMRSIRKDITQQELCCQGSVELVEQCARFHIHCSARLVAEEPSVFDQKINTENLTKCLQTLKYMYNDLELKGEVCANEAEFRTYVILLNLNDGNFMWEVQQLRHEIQKSPQIRFALDVYSALDKNNYIRFFKLVQSTTYLNACILMRYFVQVRLAALNILLKCSRPPQRHVQPLFPVAELTKLLAFEDDTATIDFTEEHGVYVNDEKTHVILDKNTFNLPEYPYALDRAINVIESKRQCSVGEVVCGTDLPPKVYMEHTPQNSFDSEGYLRLTDEDLQGADTVDAVEPEEEPMKEVKVIPKLFEEREKEIPKGFWTTPTQDALEVFAKKPLKLQQTNMSIFAKPLVPMTQPFSFAFPPTVSTPAPPQPPNYDKIREEQRKQEELAQRKQEELEQKRIKLEMEEKQRRERLELQHKKQLEEQEQRIKLLEERKKQMRELERIIEEKRQVELETLRKKQEAIARESNRKKQEEIHQCVDLLLDEILSAVEAKLQREKLFEIRQKIQQRLLVKFARRWRDASLKSKRKRKAIECSPVWASLKTPQEEAGELHTASQDLTLKYMKRYKLGYAYEIPIMETEKIAKINLYELTYHLLIKRYGELDIKPAPKHIFWKVVVSLPDEQEMPNGLSKITDTFQEFIQWDQHAAIEKFVVNPSETITYCLWKQQGFTVDHHDANAFVFVADDFNACLQKRILENLRDLGVHAKVPLVLILKHFDNTTNIKLQTLVQQGIISHYAILVDNFTPGSLCGMFEEGVVFLASKLERPPPLELDTVYGFLEKYLCRETWRRANSFTKWNAGYKGCLRTPNVCLGLYNEAVERLSKIVFDENAREYADFPAVFQEFLPSEIPDYLPCTYRYFPRFWKTQGYLDKLQAVFKQLPLPLWLEQWPPTNEMQLEINLSKYCTQIYKKPEAVFYKVMSVFLRYVDPQVNFHDVDEVLWTDVVEVLALEKLRELELSLQNSEFEKTVFNQFIVIYDTFKLKAFTNSDWFYVGNGLVKDSLKKQLQKQKKMDENVQVVTLGVSAEDLDKTLMEVTRQLQNTPNRKRWKEELENFESLMMDLESSMEVHRKISENFEHTLKRIISE